jgi:hypothetical protein
MPTRRQAKRGLKESARTQSAHDMPDRCQRNCEVWWTLKSGYKHRLLPVTTSHHMTPSSADASASCKLLDARVLLLSMICLVACAAANPKQQPPNCGNYLQNLSALVAARMSSRSLAVSPLTLLL